MRYVNIHAEINQADLDYVNEKLTEAGVKVPRAIANVLNRVGRDLRKKLVAGARKVYAYKDGFRIGDIKMNTASPGMLNVLLKNAGRTHTLRHWRHTISAKQGVKATVVKGGVKPLINQAGAKAFMGRGGNVAGLIVQRIKKARMPLRVPHGPSVPKMLEMVYKGKRGTPMQPETEKKLHDELYAEVAKHI